MNAPPPSLERLDRRITKTLADISPTLLRVSIGIVYFWFGVLKFVPGLSPATDIAVNTMETMTFGLVQPPGSLYFLAAWECLVGLGLIFGVLMRAVILLLLMQMVGTVMPIFVFPDETWIRAPIAPTLEGQYIIKNLVIVSAALVIGSTVRGGRMVSDPEVAEQAKREEARRTRSHRGH